MFQLNGPARPGLTFKAGTRIRRKIYKEELDLKHALSYIIGKVL